MAVHRETTDTPDRVPPQSTDLEMCVLGGIMLDPVEAYPIVADCLCESSFYLEGHGMLFRLMGELMARGIPPDMNAVLDELRSRELLDKVGGSGVVMGMLNSVPTAANVDWHAKKVAEKAKGRDLITVCSKAIGQAYIQTVPVDEIADSAQGDLAALAGGGSAATPDLSEILVSNIDRAASWWSEIDLARKEGRRPGRKAVGFSTGFYDLDRYLCGLKLGEVCVIAARPSVGKTALGLNILRNLALGGTPCAMVSYEMAAADLAWRLVAMGTYVAPKDSYSAPGGVSVAEVFSTWLSDDQRRKVWDSSTAIDDLPLSLEAAAGEQLRDLRAQLRRLKTERGIQVAAVDYLGLMEGTRFRDQRVQEMGELSRGIKRIAVDLNINILLLAQLSRKVEGRTVKRPVLSDLRDSGEIEQDADQVVFIHRPDFDPSQDRKLFSFDPAELIVAKNRNYPTGRADLIYLPDLTLFLNATRSKK